MAYFVTGATGFIGRFLVERLFEREGEIHVLVRKGSTRKLDELLKRWDQPDRITAVIGDLAQPGLGISTQWIDAHADRVDHFFHLAAIYDMIAEEERNRVANVEGTRHAVEVANALRVGCLHHVSSVAAAGLYEGVFTEDMFDEGQPLDHPYHRTKFESEKIARTKTTVPWRVYRPAIVVGHSQTGEMDKVDGPYYFFKAIRLGARLPQLLPLLGPRLGNTNIVPVDFVAAALDHIAHEEGLDGHAFHLVSPEPQRSVDVINAFARVAGAPRLIEALPKATLPLGMRLPGVRGLLLQRLGIPGQALEYVGFNARFDRRRTEQALAGTGIAVPPLESYAPRLWEYWERNLSPDGEARQGRAPAA
jgi:thioester reductase-like protein